MHQLEVINRMARIGLLVVFSGLMSATAVAQGPASEDAAGEWGPWVGPWERVGDGPVASDPNGGDLQAGPQGVVRHGEAYLMFAMNTMRLTTIDGRRNEARVTRLLTSDDGTTWHLGAGPLLVPQRDYEGPYALTKAVVPDPDDDRLRLYYFGKVDDLEERACLAFYDPATGLIQRSDANPVLAVDDLDEAYERLFPASVVQDRGKWWMVYDAGYGYKHPTHPRAYVIRLALSDDGLDFKPLDGNLLDPGEAGAWDSAWVSQPAVQKLGDWWYMLYAGQSKANADKAGQSFGLARARSLTGPWERYPENPIFTPAEGNAWDSGLVQHPCPVRVGDTWSLYYTARPALGPYAVGRAILQRPSSEP